MARAPRIKTALEIASEDVIAAERVCARERQRLRTQEERLALAEQELDRAIAKQAEARMTGEL